MNRSTLPEYSPDHHTREVEPPRALTACVGCWSALCDAAECACWCHRHETATERLLERLRFERDLAVPRG